MNASELRLKARASLYRNYWPAVGAAFVASIFGALISSASARSEINWQQEFETLPQSIKGILMAIIATVGTISLVKMILGGVIQIGYADYLLKQQDGDICSVKDLFSKFDNFGQGFLQKFLCDLYIFLWSLLFVIPGIIKGLAYSMTPFLMAENPELTAREAIKLSQQKMEGHKWELFCLMVSFIGWEILAILTAGIGYIFLYPYLNAAYAAFYRDKIAPKTVVYTESYIPPQIDVTM